jgi:maltose-binding protein MalE
MGNFWDPAAAMGNAIVNGNVTHDNAAEEIQKTNDQMNNSGI